MKVLICGIDGYLGWPLAIHLARQGHHVSGIDNQSRRALVESVGGCSAIPIQDISQRIRNLQECSHYPVSYFHGDITDYPFIEGTLRTVQPECIVHLAEMPSAPYSMMGINQAAYTHNNNVTGTLNLLYAIKEICPSAHLVKLGSMGEYGTPTCDIPEGFFPENAVWMEEEALVENGPEVGSLSGMMFPRKAGSWYHLTKVHDTHNIEFACRNWGLRSTDIMQGVVYGTRTPDACRSDIGELNTRFDFDECFGTVINRFCAQAVVGLSLTVYGKGKQKRGFLPLQDSIQCLTIAVEKPAKGGEYRVWNQFEEVYSITQLAGEVKKVASLNNLGTPDIVNIPNPRNEEEEHYYAPDCKTLFDLGYKPTNDLRGQLRDMIQDLIPHKQRILDHAVCLAPKTLWD